MITLTPQAQKLRDDYLRSVREHFRGSKNVDGEEVARDIAEHIERELQDAPQPVCEKDMAGVIERLGSPEQWAGESEQPSSTPPSATEEQFTKKFAVAPGGTLVVDVDFGSIAVSTNNTNEVVVDIWRKVGGKGAADKHGFSHKFHFPFHFNFPKDCGMAVGDFGSFEFNKNGVKFAAKQVNANTGHGPEVVLDLKVGDQGGEPDAAEAQRFFHDHPVSITQDGDVVTVEAEHGDEHEHGHGHGHRRWSGRKEAKYVISVPAQFNARLETAGGSISVNDLAGKVKAESSGGELRFARVQGTLKGETSGGGIQVTDCTGAIKIETSGGGIEVTGGSGSLNGETSGGPVKVKDFQGNVDVETSGAGITIENVAGEIRGETSGGGIMAVLPTPLAGAVRLETSGGGITLRVPENAAFELDAETSGGSVTSELPVTTVGSVGRSHLRGTVNGGGKSVQLESSGGGIHIKKL
jgi:hypothetical protein